MLITFCLILCFFMDFRVFFYVKQLIFISVVLSTVFCKLPITAEYVTIITFAIFLQIFQFQFPVLRKQFQINIKFMGAQNCCSSQVAAKLVANIPDPTGQPQDPLLSKKEIIDAITFDPHINYFSNQLEGVMMPNAKAKKRLKSKDELVFATTDKKQYESYIQILNNSIRGNQLSTTNVLSFLFGQLADLRQREEVEAKFKNQKYSALKCFVYLYTGNYAYKLVNNSLRKNQYQKLAPIIALIKNQLKMFSKQNSTLANRNIGLLFRAIDTPDPTMVEKSKLYWRGFTSTALTKEVTKSFGRYQYTIALKKGLPHEYLIIPKEMSRFEQQQVLIFPYFYFQVSRVVPFKANKSESYDIIQMPPEIDLEDTKDNLKSTAHHAQQEAPATVS